MWFWAVDGEVIRLFAVNWGLPIFCFRLRFIVAAAPAMPMIGTLLPFQLNALSNVLNKIYEAM